MQRFNGNYHKMQFVGEKFIVKKDLGIVICKQQYIIPSYGINYPNSSFYTDDWCIETTGVARCSKNDTFDETAGKRIAQTKANAKAYLKYAKWARDIYNNTLEIKEKCFNTLNVALELASNETAKLKDFSK